MQEQDLNQDAEGTHEAEDKNSNDKRFEEWLKSLKPIEVDPETEERMLLSMIEDLKILNSYMINK